MRVPVVLRVDVVELRVVGVVVALRSELRVVVEELRDVGVVGAVVVLRSEERVVGVVVVPRSEERGSTVERVGVVLRVVVVDVPRVSVVPRVSLVLRVSDVPRVVVPRVSVVLREAGVPVLVPPREPPTGRFVEEELLLVWLLLTCVPVEGLWSRVISAVLIVGLLLPGVQVPVGMGAEVLG